MPITHSVGGNSLEHFVVALGLHAPELPQLCLGPDTVENDHIVMESHRFGMLASPECLQRLLATRIPIGNEKDLQTLGVHVGVRYAIVGSAL